MARIVFLGTPEFAVPSLKKLIATQDVVGVVTPPDRPSGRGRRLTSPPVKIVAESAGIPVYQPQSLRSVEAAAPLLDWRPDLIIVAAFGQILRAHVLFMPDRGCLNVHASLLPRWRGASPIQHAILAGDKETGVSLMQMEEGLDTGPIYAQDSISIGQEETAATLHDRLANLGADMLVRYLDDILVGHLPAQPQDDVASTYAPMIKKEQGTIDWTLTAKEVDRHIRAMTPWPSAFTTWRGKLLKVLAAEPVEKVNLPAGHAGDVVSYQDTAAVLTSNDGLKLLKVQLSGKRAAGAAVFLQGQPQFIGSRLPN
jgi:methionyl-tRNA formyltransferase